MRRQTVLVLRSGAIIVVAALAAVLGQPSGRSAASPSGSADVAARFLPPPADPIAWQDVHWQRVADPGGALGGPLHQSIGRVIAGGPGLVATGTDARGLEGAQDEFSAVWVSSNGFDWRKFELNVGVRKGDAASVQHVVAGPAGLVIAGSVCCGEEAPALWWSADGFGWGRQPLPAGVGPNGFIFGLAAGPDGYVAVGSIGQRGAIWTSIDGRAWAAVDADAADLLPGSIGGIARASDGWIAVGQIDGRPTRDGGVWVSSDLVGWHRVPDQPSLAGDDEVELYRPVPFAGGVLAIGGQGTHEDRLACERFLGGAHLASIDDDRVANSCGWTFETHYLSRDGLTWERLPDLFPRKPQPLPDPLPPRRLISWQTVVAGGPGLVVVDPELIGRADSSNSSALWTSADGRTWVRVGDRPQLPENEQPVSVVVAGRTVFAAGERPGGDATVWRGAVLP
jgi:hypothetical protein